MSFVRRRDSEFPGQGLQSLAGRLHASRFRVSQAFPDCCDRLLPISLRRPFDQTLIGARILHHDFRFAIDGQNERFTTGMQLPQIVRRLPFEVGQRVDAVFEIDPWFLLRTEFNANSRLTSFRRRRKTDHPPSRRPACKGPSALPIGTMPATTRRNHHPRRPFRPRTRGFPITFSEVA